MKNRGWSDFKISNGPYSKSNGFSWGASFTMVYYFSGIAQWTDGAEKSQADYFNIFKLWIISGGYFKNVWVYGRVCHQTFRRF